MKQACQDCRDCIRSNWHCCIYQAVQDASQSGKAVISLSIAVAVAAANLQAPRPPAGPRRSTRAHPVVDEDEHAGDEAEGDYGAGSSRAAAAAASTPRRRGSRAAAEAGVESDGGASTGKARGARGRKAAAAAVPGGWVGSSSSFQCLASLMMHCRIANRQPVLTYSHLKREVVGGPAELQW